DTGLYYLNARYYNPKIGRFLSEDPVGPTVGDATTYNIHSYVRNNPQAFSDPSGQDALLATAVYFIPGVGEAALALTGVIVGIGITAWAVDHLSQDLYQYAKSRNKPEQKGIPNSTKLKWGKNGKLEKYTTYDENGNYSKEVRLTGKDHGPVPRPNVKEPNYNTNPKTGETFRNGDVVRRARPDELPRYLRPEPI
ncbi:MAG: hypothetical protein K6T81_20995, partial [Alicyclobacillus macrosporangiidus]|uniref:RHS repeat-associated core domain-containing protein n=1 Tax=Alicyclobacillus macrosporangiidus TaxID=392015 RepID=UPI0026F35872